MSEVREMAGVAGRLASDASCTTWARVFQSDSPGRVGVRVGASDSPGIILTPEAALRFARQIEECAYRITEANKKEGK